MNVILSRNQSENNTIGKDIITIDTVSAVVKGAISLYTPVLILTYDSDITNINYAYISEYGRYYFIDDITPMTGNRYELRLRCDVLESFKSSIKSLVCIVDKQEHTEKRNMYINDGSFVSQSNEQNRIINFPNGFNEDGEYILICAGG